MGDERPLALRYCSYRTAAQQAARGRGARGAAACACRRRRRRRRGPAREGRERSVCAWGTPKIQSAKTTGKIKHRTITANIGDLNIPARKTEYFRLFFRRRRARTPLRCEPISKRKVFERAARRRVERPKAPLKTHS